MRKIKWGVLGTAYICERDTVPGMMMAKNCELYAIAGRNSEKVKRFQEKYEFEKGYLDYLSLLNDPEVEAVYIPLPNTLHYEWTLEALKHKKHVLCEKPLAPTKTQAVKMFETAKENGVCLMEAFAYLQSPYIQAINQELISGSIGALRYMNVHFTTSDYDISNIRMRKETLGGSMYDIGVYASSLILRMFGENPKKVQAISCLDENGVDKLTTVMLAYKDQKYAVLTTGMVMATEKNKSSDSFEIHGTEGTLRSDNFTFNGNGRLSYTVERYDGTIELKEVDVPNNYMLEIEQFGRCISDNEMLAVTEKISIGNAGIVDQVLNMIEY